MRILLTISILIAFHGCAWAGQILVGKATFYTVESVLAEGNTGITASGQKFDESKMTCALRHRPFGGQYRVTNNKNGRSITVRHNDFGPGKKPAARGVVIDLSPAAFDALGGKRGKNWGEMDVMVEKI